MQLETRYTVSSDIRGPYLYSTMDPPRIVLNKLEEIGYIVISMSSMSNDDGTKTVWTLHINK